MSAAKSSGSAGGAALAWSGDDPITYTRVMAALGNADIKMFDIAENDQFMGVPQISGPRYRVIIAESDLARAEKVIREALNEPKQE
ncbi:MAG TPA: hypothetical protein VIY69_05710 [Candidatus Acidoferrales bacterium]